jgi:hypothetical protein
VRAGAATGPRQSIATGLRAILSGAARAGVELPDRRLEAENLTLRTVAMPR